jgi:hypothetical protein
MSLEADTLYGSSSFVGLAHYRASPRTAGSGCPLEHRPSRGLHHHLESSAGARPRAPPAASLCKGRGALAFCLLLPPSLRQPSWPSCSCWCSAGARASEHGRLGTSRPPALDWLKDPAVIPVSLVLQAVWRWTGFVTSSSGGPRRFCTRAYVEMARAKERTAGDLPRRDLPHLSPSSRFCAVCSFLDAFVSFAEPTSCGASGGTSDAGLLLVGLVYRPRSPTVASGRRLR